MHRGPCRPLPVPLCRQNQAIPTTLMGISPQCLECWGPRRQREGRGKCDVCSPHQRPALPFLWWSSLPEEMAVLPTGCVGVQECRRTCSAAPLVSWASSSGPEDLARLLGLGPRCTHSSLLQPTEQFNGQGTSFNGGSVSYSQPGLSGVWAWATRRLPGQASHPGCLAIPLTVLCSTACPVHPWLSQFPTSGKSHATHDAQ